MKITDGRNIPLVDFYSLSIGDVFQWDDNVYMKISISCYDCNNHEPYKNALLLTGSKWIKESHFDGDEKVILREAELILK